MIRDVNDVEVFLSKYVCSIDDSFCCIMIGSDNSNWVSFNLDIVGFVMFVKEFYGVNLQVANHLSDISYDDNVITSIIIDPDVHDLMLSSVIEGKSFSAVYTFGMNVSMKEGIYFERMSE